MRMWCARCDVLWRGEHESPCWVCTRPGTPKTVNSEPTGAHVHDLGVRNVTVGNSAIPV